MDAIESILRHKEVAIDCETARNYVHNKKAALVYWQGYIRIITFTTQDGDFLWDLGYNQLNLRSYRNRLRRLFSILEDKEITKVFHNSLFDLCYLGYQFKRMGFEYPKYQSINDTMLCSQWMWAGCNPKFTKHSLKELSLRLNTGEPVDKTDQKSDWGAIILDEEQQKYAKADTRITFKCYQRFKEIEQTLSSYKELFSIICGSIPAFANMMLKGIPIDYNMMLQSYEQHYSKYLEALKVWHDTFPQIPPTVDPTKLVLLIKKRYGVELESADEESLKPLAEKYPEFQALLDCRLMSKSVKLYEQWSDCYRDGSVFAAYNIAASSASGRSSSTKVGNATGFNAQNVIKPYSKKSKFYGLINARDCVRASEGKKLIISDYSAAHGRIATSLSQDEFLVKAYRDGYDMHCLTAANLCMVSDSPEEFRNGDFMQRYHTIQSEYENGNADAKKLRDISKIYFYAGLNIGGRQRIANTIGISVQDAAKGLNAFWSTYSGLDAFIRSLGKKLLPRKTEDGDSQTEIEINGIPYRKLRMPTGCFRYFEVRETKYGRQCYLPDMASSQWLTCEGISMSISITELHYLFTYIYPEWDARIVCCVHDEIVVECKEKYALVCEETMYNVMDKDMQKWIEGFPASPPYKPGSMIADAWSEK